MNPRLHFLKKFKRDHQTQTDNWDITMKVSDWLIILSRTEEINSSLLLKKHVSYTKQATASSQL